MSRNSKPNDIPNIFKTRDNRSTAWVHRSFTGNSLKIYHTRHDCAKAEMITRQLQ